MKKSLLFISALISGAASFAQVIPNGNFENWTNATSPANWSKQWDISGLLTATKSTTDSVAGYVGSSAIQVHSAQVSGTNYAPGVAISGANAFSKMAITGFPPAVPTITRAGSFTVTARPATLSGFAKYSTIGTNHGAIGIEIFDGANIVGAYSLGEFAIDPSTKFTNFNIPITYTNTATTVDSVRITLGTSLVITASETPTAGDTLIVDMLRFFSCTVDPAVTLAAPSVTPSAPPAGLAATGTLNLTPNAAYNQTFTFSVPDPSIGTLMTPFGPADYTLTPIDSIVFGDVSVLTGLTFKQGYPGGVAYPNSKYCYSISGNIPPTNNVLHKMKIVQTPYGTVTVSFAGNPLGSTSVPIGSITPPPPLPAQAVDLRNTAVDSIMIQVGTPIGIADFDFAGGLGLSQNKPNPFDGSTTINFNCPVSGNVTFSVVDVLGRQVYDTNINATAGSNTFTYSTDLSNGTYFFSISDGTNTVTRKMVISE